MSTQPDLRREPDGRLAIASQRYDDGPTLSVADRWTGEPLARVVMADGSRAEEAIVACVAAFERTRAMRAYERRDLLRRAAASIASRKESLATLIARESGKPIAQALGEVVRAVSTFEIGAEEATRIGGEVMPLDITPVSAGYSGQWMRQGRGPILGIAPFNFPLNLVAHKIVPALACGCSIVLKPPPQAPLTSIALAEILRDAGMPENAVQIVPCDNDVAERMVKDARFKTLSFTGSAKVGWYLKSIAGKKHVLLELGGNAAAIVHEDAKLAWAAERIVAGAFGYAGQVCIKVQRLYVHRPIADAFVADLVLRAQSLAPSNPLDPKTVLGPMIDEANAKRVLAWVDEARAAGAVPLVLGKREGAKLGPTILAFDGDGLGTKVVDEEIFGPVLTVHRYDTWSDALRMADATRYGLQAGIFTDSHARIREAFERLNVGGLIVNDTPTFRVDSMPYGGARDSGFGREGVRFAIEEMTDRKLLVFRD
jgi:acyl-CoA reductase-like NAD-dependent aldehyde dehydrogenase